MARIKIILNPAADNGRGIQQRDVIGSLVQAAGDVEIVESETGAHARELARQAVLEGCEMVVAAGGDGTVHQVVNGILGVREGTAVLGVIPIGSGNDFAYANAIPVTVPEAVNLLFTGRVKAVDVARVEDENGRFVIMDNNFGAGFDAEVVVQTERIHRVHGFLKYFIAVLKSIAFYFHTYHIQMRFDAEEVVQNVLFLYLGIGPRGGGGFLLTPDARQDDGLVDSCLVNPVNRLTMLQMLSKGIKGTHITSKHVTMRRNQQIVLRLDDPTPIYVDGEVFAYGEDHLRQVTITSMPGVLSLIA